MVTDAPGWSIRPVHPDDAASFIAHRRSVIAEPINNLLSEPSEFILTEQQQREFLVEQGMRPDWACFVAAPEADLSHVIGHVMVDGKRRRAIRHRASVGLSVTSAWRGRGIGRALMEQAITWARETGFITRLELEVLTRNTSAVHLYERLGFAREGLLQRALLRNGEYLDLLTMALLL